MLPTTCLFCCRVQASYNARIVICWPAELLVGARAGGDVRPACVLPYDLPPATLRQIQRIIFDELIGELIGRTDSRLFGREDTLVTDTWMERETIATQNTVLSR